MKNLNLTSLISIGFLLFASIGQAATLKFGGPIDGAQAGTASTAVGSAIVTLETEQNTFDLTININGLANDLSASHIHIGAPGVNGGVIVDIGDMAVYDVIGEFYSYQATDVAFPSENLVDLLAGETYLNFHTSEFAAGEVRGQLLPIEVDGDSLLGLSTRGMVNPGQGKAALLIGGLVLTERKTILFRMVAESLTRFGVQTGLKDTSFEVFKLNPDLPSAAVIGGNDNWKEGGQQYQIAASGFAPAFDNESVLIMTLDPGSYTLNAESEQGAGIALVETYGIELKGIGSSIALAATGSLSQSFTTLNAMLEVTGLNGILDGPGPFTLFAPTDEAFLASFTQGELDELLADDADKADDLNTLTALLMHHVVGNKILSAGLIDGVTLTVSDLAGSDVDILLDSGVITVLNATVVEHDILTSNGAIHVVDAVLAP